MLCMKRLRAAHTLHSDQKMYLPDVVVVDGVVVVVDEVIIVIVVVEVETQALVRELHLYGPQFDTVLKKVQDPPHSASQLFPANPMAHFVETCPQQRSH
jgi:hypothetical protein